MRRKLLLPLLLTALLAWNQVTVAAPSIYVIAMTSNDFVTRTLPRMLDQYGRQNGVDVELIITPSISEAIFRQFALEAPIDVILVPFIHYIELRDVGWLEDMGNVLEDLRPTAVQSTGQPLRWMWGSVDGMPRCGYVPGGGRQEPSFICLWKYAQQPKQAADLVYYLVEHADTTESPEATALTFARKLLIEKDYGSIYDHLLHPDRQSLVTRQEFIQSMERMQPCRRGVIDNLRFSAQEDNWNNLTDPRSGTEYATGSLTTFYMALDCIFPDEERSLGISFVMDPNQPEVPRFFPYETVTTSWGEG